MEHNENVYDTKKEEENVGTVNSEEKNCQSNNWHDCRQSQNARRENFQCKGKRKNEETMKKEKKKGRK